MIRITSEQFSSDIDRSMTMLDKYINGIIRSCFIKEGRSYDPLCFCYRYIVVETPAGNRVLYSVHSWFKYQRVLSEFNRRMYRYLYDSTSIIYNKIESNDEHVSYSSAFMPRYLNNNFSYLKDGIHSPLGMSS